MDASKESFLEEYLQRIFIDLKTTKVNGADYIFICLHFGGRLNREPRDFTSHVMDIIVISVDCTAIIGKYL